MTRLSANYLHILVNVRSIYPLHPRLYKLTYSLLEDPKQDRRWLALPRNNGKIDTPPLTGEKYQKKE